MTLGKYFEDENSSVWSSAIRPSCRNLVSMGTLAIKIVARRLRYRGCVEPAAEEKRYAEEAHRTSQWKQTPTDHN